MVFAASVADAYGSERPEAEPEAVSVVAGDSVFELPESCVYVAAGYGCDAEGGDSSAVENWPCMLGCSSGSVFGVLAGLGSGASVSLVLLDEG